jgi:hypothetical protein
MSKRFTYYSADVTDVFLLDAYPNAKVAYSMRKLSSTYTGACIRVRRSSDNTEQDIGFVNDELDTTALLSFVGSNNGYVTTWYNQKGTGSNLNNLTAINQPLIVNSGVVETVNGRPAILGDTNSALFAGNTTTFKYLHDGTIKASTVSVMKTGANVTSTHFYWLTTLATSTSIGVNNFLFSGILRQDVRNGGAAIIRTDGSIATNTQYTFFQIHDAANPINADKVIMNINNGSDIKTNTSSFTPSTANSSFRLSVFNYRLPANNLGLDGHIQEMIFWNDDYSADKSAINSNINDYYSIY